MPKGNKQATGKKSKRGPELVQRVRGALLSALDILEEDGKRIDLLLVDVANDSPLKFLELVSKYCPKDAVIQHTGEIRYSHDNQPISDSASFINEAIREEAERASTKPLPH